MSTQTISFSKLDSSAKIPYKRTEDAGYDIYACLKTGYLIIKPFETQLIPTGIASCFSSEYCFKLEERSSTGLLGISLRSGVIDSGYRGEWFIPITNLNPNPIYFINSDCFMHSCICSEMINNITIKKRSMVFSTSMAICQALLLSVPNVKIVEIPYEELLLEKSQRMNRKFGSSGK